MPETRLDTPSLAIGSGGLWRYRGPWAGGRGQPVFGWSMGISAWAFVTFRELMRNRGKESSHSLCVRRSQVSSFLII